MRPDEIDWFPLLDDDGTDAGGMMTVEEIGQCSDPDQLRACYLKCMEAPLSEVQRSAMLAAINARASQLNISTYDFKPYDGGTMAQAAEEMQEGMSDCTVAGDTGAVVALLDAAPGKPLRFRFKGSHADVISLNDRVYLHEIIDPAVDRINARLASGQSVFGEELHPPLDVVDQANPKRKWFRRTRSKAILQPERAFWEGDELLVDARVVEDTLPGKQLADDLRAGRRVLFSQRAYSGPQKVVPLTDGRQVKVPLIMEIETWDRVPNPAIPDATALTLLDSVQVQALCDAIHEPAHDPAPAAHKPNEGESAVKWSKTMVEALAKSGEGRRELASALNDATLDAEIRTAITDALATLLSAAPAPAAASAVPADAITQAVTDAMARRDEQERQAREQAASRRAEAAAFVKERIGALRTANKYPSTVLDGIATALTDCADKAAAEAQLNERLAMADSFAAAGFLGSLGYRGGANGATMNGPQVEIVGDQSFKAIYGGLMDEIDAYRASLPGETKPDLELRKANKPFVDKVLRKFDAANAKAMIDAVNAWNTLTDSTTITTADVWTQVVVQRAIIEQVFGDADMLQFLGTDVFDGVTMTIPVEYYEASGSPGHHTGENQGMARGKVHVAWIPFTAGPRRIATEITNDVQRALQAGPLNYNTAARALYHVMAEIRRVINIEAGNEMLRAADAYGAQTVAAETAQAAEITAVNDAGNVKYKVTLRRGGVSGNLGVAADAPVVRPRPYTSFDVRGQQTTVVENAITVKVNNVAVPARYLRTDDAGVVTIVDEAGVAADGYAVDYEYGYLYISEAYTVTPGVSDCVVGYSYATNFTTFSLAIPNGYKRSEWYSELLHTTDDAKALMAKAPRYRAPNIAIGSIAAMNPVIQSDLFYVRNSPNGTVLSATANFLAHRNGLDFASHNTQWQAGDRRILLGTARATKYAVRDPLAQKGPFPMIDPATGHALPGEQWYVEGWDALVTPEIKTQSGQTLNPYYRTIILK